MYPGVEISKKVTCPASNDRHNDWPVALLMLPAFQSRNHYRPHTGGKILPSSRGKGVN